MVEKKLIQIIERGYNSENQKAFRITYKIRQNKNCNIVYKIFFCFITFEYFVMTEFLAIFKYLFAENNFLLIFLSETYFQR